MDMTFKIHFGMDADELSKQITDQGFKFKTLEVDSFQDDLDAINILYFRNYISEKIRKEACEKLFTRIESHVLKVNKLKKVSAPKPITAKA